MSEPTDFEYGERQYQARDPFGHHWTFTETIADVAPQDWGGVMVEDSLTSGPVSAHLHPEGHRPS